MTSKINEHELDSHEETSPRFEFDHDAYAEVSRSAELNDIRLIRTEYSIKPEINQAMDDFAKMNHGFVGVCDDFNFDPEMGIAIGNYRWTAEIKYGRKKVLKLVANYLISYSDVNNFDEVYVRFYFHKIGRFTTYPYFRALFSHHTAESGLMLPPLPSLNERVD